MRPSGSSCACKVRPDIRANAKSLIDLTPQVLSGTSPSKLDQAAAATSPSGRDHSALGLTHRLAMASTTHGEFGDVLGSVIVSVCLDWLMQYMQLSSCTVDATELIREIFE